MMADKPELSIAHDTWDTVPEDAQAALLDAFARLRGREAVLNRRIATLTANDGEPQKPPQPKPPIGDPPPPPKPVKAGGPAG